MYTMGETKENWVTCQNGQNLHLKCDLQLKPKEDIEDGESQFGNIIRKSTVNKDKVVVQISVTVFSVDQSLVQWGRQPYKWRLFLQV